MLIPQHRAARLPLSEVLSGFSSHDWLPQGRAGPEGKSISQSEVQQVLVESGVLSPSTRGLTTGLTIFRAKPSPCARRHDSTLRDAPIEQTCGVSRPNCPSTKVEEEGGREEGRGEGRRSRRKHSQATIPRIWAEIRAQLSASCGVSGLDRNAEPTVVIESVPNTEFWEWQMPAAVPFGCILARGLARSSI